MESLPQEAISNHAEWDVAPDINPDSAFWKDAPRLVMTNDAYGRLVPGHRTEICSRWTEDNLYFLFLSPYEELHLKPEPNVTAKTNRLWNWDVAEAFIGSIGDPMHRYKEFELSPQGEWLDLDVNLEKPDKINDPSWSSGFEVAAQIEPAKTIWYGYMRIPYTVIESGKAAAGNILRINFFRSQGPNHVEMAWQPPLQKSFHAPEQFGLLQLVP